MQAAVGFHAPVTHYARRHTYLPPCAPSSSGSPAIRQGVASRLIARAGKDGKDDRGKDDRIKEKADFSALWALRVKNFFSSRRKYLEQAEQAGEADSEKAFQAEVAREEDKLRKTREEIIATREEELQQQAEEGELSEGLVAGDIARARFDLQESPLTKAALAVVRVRELLRALLLLPFNLLGAAVQSWQVLFSTQRYENFLMAEGERIWYWRNRTENERWFWEIFVWDRLLFPILAIVCYEYLVPNHLLWSVVAPTALLGWLSGRLPAPDTPEFWMLAYFGFYRKAWPDLSAWLAANVAPMLAF